MTRGILFSDVDGTLVHYPDVVDKLGEYGERSEDGKGHIFKGIDGKEHTFIRLHPSTTGMQGVISLRTIELMAETRKLGFKVAIISGARTSTMMQRMPFLPFADAIVTENGGRIFLLDQRMLNAAPYFEDASWRDSHSDVAGSCMQDGTPAKDRQGLLWDVHRKLSKDGWTLDSVSYSTSFRVKVKAPKTTAELERVLQELCDRKTLAFSFNLGMADVYPATSGKEMAAKYLMGLWGAEPSSCSLLCDDDNDLGLAAAVGRVFLPSIAADSMRDAAAAEPEKFFVACSGGPLGTEEAIEAFLDGQRPDSDVPSHDVM